jgi:hypothetical protein
VAEGTPEEVAEMEGSYTGGFLRKALSVESRTRQEDPSLRSG